MTERDTHWWHEASAPRQVKNGIKARSKRGRFLPKAHMRSYLVASRTSTQRGW